MNQLVFQRAEEALHQGLIALGHRGKAFVVLTSDTIHAVNVPIQQQCLVSVASAYTDGVIIRKYIHR